MKKKKKDSSLVHADLPGVKIPARQEHPASRHQAAEHFHNEERAGKLKNEKIKKLKN